MMASDDKKTKAAPAPKDEAPSKKTKDEVPSKKKSGSDAEPSKPESGKTEGKTDVGEPAAAAPSNYSRGEGQKPVTKAYKDNWNAIFAKKKKR
jgi:hypothetical protein